MKGETLTEQRQIFLHGPMGQRQFREVLGGQMAGLIIKPELIWLVSPWLSDFTLLDNRSGNWDALEPAWGSREVGFNEILARAVNGGCQLRVVTRDDSKNKGFVSQLKNRLDSKVDMKILMSEPLHTKGLLTSKFFLKGSMNYTFTGANKNDEHLTLSCDKNVISEAMIEFQGHYTSGDLG